MSTIVIDGADGSHWDVHGEGAGIQGVMLKEKQVEGLYDAPVKTEYKSTVRGRGGQVRNVRYLIREVSLGFMVAGERYGMPAPFAEIYSAFRKGFDYELDEWDDDAKKARCTWTTEMSGARWLDLLLADTIDFRPDRDPLVDDYGNPILPLKAEQPFWESRQKVTSWSTAATAGSGFIEVSNPTPIPMFHKFVFTRGNWSLPDVSWRGRRYHRAPAGEYHDRMIELPPVTVLQQGGTVDLDPNQLMVRDAGNTNYLGQMPTPGQFFMHKIPPYTPKTLLPVAVTGAPAGGAMVQCLQPRLWSNAWGGE